MLEKALRGQQDPAAESVPVNTAEVAGALLGMVANALRVAMVTGLPVVKGDPIPDNHVAIFREYEAPQGRILLLSLLRFCVYLLSIVEEPLLGGEGLMQKIEGCIGLLQPLPASTHPVQLGAAWRDWSGWLLLQGQQPMPVQT